MAVFKVQHRADVYYEAVIEAETVEEAIAIANQPDTKFVQTDGPYFVEFYEVYNESTEQWEEFY